MKKKSISNRFEQTALVLFTVAGMATVIGGLVVGAPWVLFGFVLLFTAALVAFALLTEPTPPVDGSLGTSLEVSKANTTVKSWPRVQDAPQRVA